MAQGVRGRVTDHSLKEYVAATAAFRVGTTFLETVNDRIEKSGLYSGGSGLGRGKMNQVNGMAPDKTASCSEIRLHIK
ncbi:hypothetical protein [Pseudomonas putida]|uniref:Uncharacterized protein n=1 Tax=Pseudomonas putida TaxID=303 RepID=A0A8I1EFQ2_PSEPU|nr:hypothetical protein [Pseudomonas putida]MBI6884388.1 hypothetical protein [Pseudomonas putida]